MVEFIQKYVQYFPNGSGRDSYINANSGGFSKFMPKQIIHPHYEIIKPNKDSKVFRKINKTSWTFKYKSDGSGRDSYVLSGSGGLQAEYRPPTSFKSTLRGGYVGYENTSYSSNSNVKYISKGEHEIIKKLSKIQNSVTKRLYTSQSNNRFQDPSKKSFDANSIQDIKQIKKSNLKKPILTTLPNCQQSEKNYLKTEVIKEPESARTQTEVIKTIEAFKVNEGHAPSKSCAALNSKSNDRLVSARTRLFFNELQQYNKRLKKDGINYLFE